MNDCIDAIPAWIMPRYRLGEMLPIQAEMFDVVIVDEASQTGIDGLFLYYLGKQVIIVGDDEQISPSDVGIDTTRVTALQKRYLDDVPFHAALMPTSSLYDHANIRFGGKIVLREHFRCMPEIIEFSNQLCYAPNNTPLISLRSYSPKRLPPIVTHYVAEGYREGTDNKVTNPPEAEAIVRQIAILVKDPSYIGKSFGVISLLGDSQAEHISHLLLQEVGPEVMEERDLVCGNPYTFQGNERDIIMLSLVSAPKPGERISALTRQDAKQRFNVAASRARDQMWLFHSAKLEDLSPNPDCVRRKLLEYCLNPLKNSLSENSVNIKSMYEAISNRDHSSRPPQPFDSWFEVEVMLAIARRGYQVISQVEVSEYRIDLVIEGSQSKLAVECDGDRWHGPERYEYDMARQRQLERSGWEFFRVRGSSFYLNPEEALKPLWQILNRLSIYPYHANNLLQN
jgi:very-short-patch-repair endonuclease